MEDILLQLSNNSCRVSVSIGTPQQELYLHLSTDRSYSYVVGEDALMYDDDTKYKKWNFICVNCKEKLFIR